MSRMRPLTVLLIVLCAAGLLGSCSEFAPYPTTPRPASGQPVPTLLQSMQNSFGATRVGICYSRLRSTPAEVREQAQRECPANTIAEQVDTDWYLQACPLLLPERGTFTCNARK